MWPNWLWSMQQRRFRSPSHSLLRCADLFCQQRSCQAFPSLSPTWRFCPQHTVGPSHQVTSVMADIDMDSLVSSLGEWGASTWIAPVIRAACNLHDYSETDAADLAMRAYKANLGVPICPPVLSPRVAMSRRTSCACGARVRPDVVAATHATIVGCAGSSECLHVPLRCVKRDCRNRWYASYGVQDGQHLLDQHFLGTSPVFVSATQGFDMD